MLAQVRGVRWRYANGEFELAIDEFEVAHGERIAVVGPSGCGKSTLLGVLAGLLRPALGTVTIGGDELTSAPESRVRFIRAARLGLVHQDFQLFEPLTVLDNILLPFHVCPALTLTDVAAHRAAELAARAGVGHLLRRKVTRISQGERQRVAVCRALAAAPQLVLADEPTASLDERTRGQVVDLLLQECDRAKAALVVATHDNELVARMGRTVRVTTDGTGSARVGNGADAREVAQ